MWRHKLFLCLLLLVLAVQGFLAYKSLSIDNLATSYYSDINNVELEIKRTEQFLQPDIPTLSTTAAIKELGIAATCELKSKEALSAVQRARTQACRQLIMQTACAIQEGKFYPNYLQTHCPAGELQANISIGCYRDAKEERLLPDMVVHFKTNNTPQRCIDICLQSGYPYAGVEYGSECFCGNDAPPTSAQLPDSSCSIKCPGNARIVCGGYYAINIYNTGIARFVPQHAENSMPGNDKQRVRIAFLLTLNGRALRQVHRLIKALYEPQHSFYIHVDARQDYLYRQLLPLEQKFPNILLARTRFATIWGGASLLTMLLQCMKDLLNKTPENFEFDFIINLSESDFPIKTVNKLVDFLSINRERNFVKSHGRETQRFIQKQGLDKTFVECDEHMWRLGDRQLPAGIQVDGGSDWVALSRSFVQYLISNAETDDLLKGLLLLFRHTLLPAESFFHTALRNTPFCDTYVDNNLHVTNWKRKLGCKCQYKHVVDWCGCSPNDFKSKDFARLTATEHKMLYFARKFEPIINQAILLQLEEWLYGPYATDVPNLHGYWQSFYAHEDAYVAVQTDLLRSMGEILARRATQQFKRPQLLHMQKLIELTHYFYQDQYKGFLIRYQVSPQEGAYYELETRVRPFAAVAFAKNCKLCDLLKDIAVSSDYDQKEEVTRNFARFLGPYSEPVITFTLMSSNNSGTKLKAQNLTVLWLDPYGRLHDFGEIALEDVPTDSVRYHKPHLKTPLLPGYWTIKMLTRNSELIVTTQFIVSPLTQLNGKPLTQAQTKRLHAGATIHALSADFEVPAVWDAHITCLASKPLNWTVQAVQAQAHFTGDFLYKWLEELTQKTHHLRETCVVDESALHLFSHKTLIALPLCRDTVWSSYAPDPKSDINALLK